MNEMIERGVFKPRAPGGPVLAGQPVDMSLFEVDQAEFTSFVWDKAATERDQVEPVLRFHHGTTSAALTLDDQSAGTRSWIAHMTRAVAALRRGAALVIDEVDASLHPQLAARLVNMFRDGEINQNGAQLIVTTHDATLLDEETLSRDEVWFVDKAPDGGVTTLFPLTDFHPRNNENTRGRYLAGAYGAVPLLIDTDFRDAITGQEGADEAA
jgi:hypothetical protein